MSVVGAIHCEQWTLSYTCCETIAHGRLQLIQTIHISSIYFTKFANMRHIIYTFSNSPGPMMQKLTIK